MIDLNTNRTPERVEVKEEKIVASKAPGEVTQPIQEKEISVTPDDVQVLGKSHAPEGRPQGSTPIVKAKGFDEGIKRVREELSKCPDALDFGNTDSDRIGKYFAFKNNSQEAVSARTNIQKTLKDVYESGAYSPGDLAARLDVEPNAVWALVDPTFRVDNNLAVHEDQLLEIKEPKEDKSSPKNQEPNKANGQPVEKREEVNPDGPKGTGKK